MVELWLCRMCLCQGYVSQQKTLEITRMEGLGSRVNRKGMLEHVSWSSICHATICPSAKDCWIDVAKMTVNQSYESSNLNQWGTWNRTLYKCSCLRPLIWKQHEKPPPLEISQSDSLWWMFMDVYSKLRFFFWLMLVKPTWPKGRRCRSQAMILQRPTRRLEGSSQLHVMVAEFLGIFLGKGCYCYGILSQEVQRPNRVPAHSNLANNPLRGVFQRAEARFNSLWSHPQPDWCHRWSDFLFIVSSLT